MHCGAIYEKDTHLELGNGDYVKVAQRNQLTWRKFGANNINFGDNMEIS